MPTESNQSLAGRDADVIWHPYTQHKKMQPPLAITRGEGACIIDENGRIYIDAISSWWTNLHGHAHPYIAEKIYEQARQLEHVIFAGCTHEPAVLLAERLLPLLPGDFSKVFYSDNGSTAVEIALKMAIQFHHNNGNNKRKRILALTNAYHGDTFGAMSISSRGVFTLTFEKFLFEVSFIEPGVPSTIPESEWDQFACFIYEPLVQGAGGMHMYDATWLNDMLCKLKQHGVICIADEVMTGFGRTGQFFASEYLHHKPDIICLSKGLTGGTMALAVTACSQRIFEAFLSDDKQKTFFHGHSFTANPIGCAAALASLDLLQDDKCLNGIEFISEQNRQFVSTLKNYPKAVNPRSTGTIIAFELQESRNEYLSGLKEKIMTLSLNEGVLLRPLGNTVYSMPPYCITHEQLKQVMNVLEKIVR